MTSTSPPLDAQNPKRIRASRLGESDVEVTRLGLGTAPLAGLFEAVSDDAGRAVVTAAYDGGIRLFDAAAIYGHGLAERRVGGALAQRARTEYVLSTKVGFLLREDAADDPSWIRDGVPVFRGTPSVNPLIDLSYDGVMTSFSESAERLGGLSVDLVYIHDPDEQIELASTAAYRALSELKQAGQVRAIGVATNSATALTEMLVRADFDCCLLAGRYTLLDQSALGSVLDLCRARGVGVVLGGVFNSGILADPAPGAKFDYRDPTPEVMQRVLRMRRVCEGFGIPLKAAAIQSPLGHPAVSSIVVGCRSTMEVHENIEAFHIEIPEEVWMTLRAEGLIDPAAPVPKA